MSSLFEEDEAPLSRRELATAKQEASNILQLWKKRAICFTAAFFLSCTAVSLFLYGHPLHAYWDSIGKYLVYLSMFLLLPFVASVGIAINSWVYLRSLQKIEQQSSASDS